MHFKTRHPKPVETRDKLQGSIIYSSMNVLSKVFVLFWSDGESSQPTRVVSLPLKKTSMVRTTQHLFNDASSVDLLLLMAFLCPSYFSHQPQVINRNTDKVGDNKNGEVNHKTGLNLSWISNGCFKWILKSVTIPCAHLSTDPKKRNVCLGADLS